MKLPRRTSLALLSTTLLVSTTTCRHPSTLQPKQPAELAQSLYADVMAHPIAEVPSGEDGKIFLRYLGQSLLHKINTYNACMADEGRQYAAYKGPPEKLDTLEDFGIFSGSVEESALGTAQVEKTEMKTDGTVRVTVKLGLPEYQMEWRVIDVFVKEDNRFVLEDVIFPGEIITKGLRDDSRPDEYLSQLLTRFCNGGTHWTGKF